MGSIWFSRSNSNNNSNSNSNSNNNNNTNNNTNSATTWTTGSKQRNNKLHPGTTTTTTTTTANRRTVVVVVEWVLVDIRRDVECDTPQGDLLLKRLETLFQSLPVTTTTTTTTLSLSSNTQTTTTTTTTTAVSLQHDITKYLKISDRYAALVSLLLKRYVSYTAATALRQQQQQLQQQQPHDDDGGCWYNVDRDIPNPFPLIQLPRTAHNKPYLPRCTLEIVPNGNASATSAAHNDNMEWFPFSISHQYPIVGMAYFRLQQQQQNVPNNNNTISNLYSNLHLGMDIVMFEDINPRLYDTVQEFVNVFWDQFAGPEQAILQQFQTNDFCLLRELYLQWAVKEAYAKALGVGMGFDFASFSTTFLNDNKECTGESVPSLSSSSSLWNYITETLAAATQRPSNNYHHLHGSNIVVQRRARISFRNDRCPDEIWMFVFQLLWWESSSSSSNNSSNNRAAASLSQEIIDQAIGCVCICWQGGPAWQEEDHNNSSSNNNSNSTKNNPHVIHWKSIDDLVKLSGGDK